MAHLMCDIHFEHTDVVFVPGKTFKTDKNVGKKYSFL